MQLNDQQYQAYTCILEWELIPAMGCTEPIAVAYSAALARKLLNKKPDRVSSTVSGNILKNVKDVSVRIRAGIKRNAQMYSFIIYNNTITEEMEIA